MQFLRKSAEIMRSWTSILTSLIGDERINDAEDDSEVDFVVTIESAAALLRGVCDVAMLLYGMNGDQ
jgi:hypothetical protein